LTFLETVGAEPRGQYWAVLNTSSEKPPPNMAAANLVVITNGEGCALDGTAVAAVLIDQ